MYSKPPRFAPPSIGNIPEEATGRGRLAINPSNERRPGRRNPHVAPEIWDYIISHWLLPVIGTILGLVLGYLLNLESGYLARLFPGVAWQTTISEARSVLSALVAIEVAILGIVMSLSLLVIQNATNQFSPRLLRLYLRDPVQQTVLATMAGSAAFYVISAVLLGFAPNQGATARPVLSFAILLFAITGVALAIEIGHLLKFIRLEVIVYQITKDTIHVADRVEAQRASLPGCSSPLPISPNATALQSPVSGYVTNIKASRFLEAAGKYRVSVRLDIGIGDYANKGSPIGWLEPDTPGASIPDGVYEGLSAAIIIGPWRDMHYDIALGIRQLVDIAIKALSPAVNDPYTAVEAIDQLTAILVHLSHCPLGDRVLCDDDNRPRVSLYGAALGDYVILATDQISRYGAAEPFVMLSLLELIRDVGVAAEPADKDSVLAAGKRILNDAERSVADPDRLEVLRRTAAEVERWITSGPTPGDRRVTNL